MSSYSFNLYVSKDAHARLYQINIIKFVIRNIYINKFVNIKKFTFDFQK